MSQITPQPLPQAQSGVRCMSCGYDLIGVAIGGHCPECGTQVNQFASTRTQTQGKAIASMVLGICSLVTCFAYGVLGMPCAILAVVYAKKARLAVQSGAAPVSSLGMATAGKVCGWIGVVLNGLMLCFLVFYVIIVIGILGAGLAGGASGQFPPSPTPMPTPVTP